ncbi:MULTISPECIES: peptide MFS transporter [Vibrio]|uniref:MFS transporter n=1 Tax=Vibrio algicola TaxID=2662262 RepID=A0A5Q0TGZ0_9VIBR|nr:MULTISPECIES: MFS transporter [Vibrio]MBD1577753.1 peptide MFS transporter [Vibrio sp. S11_S32]
MWNKLNKSMMFCQAMFGLSFYGVMVILTRFFLEKLHYSEAETMMIVGAFSSIGPLFAIAGGFIADKLLGSYRSLTISYGAFSIGYVLLVLGASSTNVPMSLVGIALASYGRGMMAPSYPSLYKRTFKTDTDFENCYPLNYSVNNIGAFLGQYLFPLFVLSIGFNGSFGLSAALASIAFITLLVLNKPLSNVSSEIDKNKVSPKNLVLFLVISAAMIGLVFFMFSNMDIGQNIVYVIGISALSYLVFLIFRSNKSEGLRIGTMLIMTMLTTFFFVYYGQMMTSMTMVSLNTMRGDLFGFIPIAPEAAMAMNPLWCIVGGPIITWIFSTLEKRGVTISTATKVAISFVLVAISFGILTVAVTGVGQDAIIRPEVFLAVYGFMSIGEVIVGSFVVAFVLSVTPKYIENFSVSLFYIAQALSGIVGAVFSTSIAMEKGQVITQAIVQTVYGDYFKLLTILALVMAVIALIGSYVIRKMLNKADACAEKLEAKPAV